MKVLFVRFSAHALRVISLGALLVVLSALGASAPVSAAPLAGLFIVNTTADNNTPDSYLTLKEAIMLSNGGTGISGLGRALTDAEINQLPGCTFSGSTNNWTIVPGTCGAGVYDSIIFASSLGVNPVINLTMTPPPINDTQPTFLNGGTVHPIINASGLGNSPGLEIRQSNGNTVENISIRNSSGRGILIDPGNNNRISNVVVTGSFADGVDISGDGNTVDQSLIGILSSGATSCGTISSGNGFGISIVGANNQVKNSYVACSKNVITHYGISITGSGNTIGPNNVIGTNSAGTAMLGNYDGIDATSATSATITTNTIAFNSQYGISLLTTNSASILSNTIYGNGLDGILLGSSNSNNLGGNVLVGNRNGILLSGTSQSNKIGGPSTGSTLTGNTISANLSDGVYIKDTAQNNLLAGNKIGVTSDGLTQEGNASNGVSIYNASNNSIGATGAAVNIISGNNGVGVFIQSANNNQVVNNYIGVNANLSGVSNTGNGVYILDALTNTVSANTIGRNTGDGIYIAAISLPSSGNQIQNNTVSFNTGDGIHIQVCSGCSANGNVVSGNSIHDNTGDGIYEASNGGTLNNVWTQISTFNNGGLGINKNPSTPAHPTIQSMIVNGGQETIAGTATPGTVSHPVTVEVYLAAPDPSGYGEGKTYIGSASVNGTGNWSLNTTPTANCITAFETYTNNTSTGSAASSDFSQNVCPSVYRLYLPLILR